MRQLVVPVVAGMLFTLAGQLHADGYEGQLAPPSGVQPSSLEVHLHRRAPSAAENARRVAETSVIPESDGTFTIPSNALEEGVDYEIEVVGPGVRRARFPMVSDGSATPRFTLNPGATSVLLVTSEATGEPIEGAIIGPVVMVDERVSTRDAERLYPFYAETDSEGRAFVHGMLDGFIAYDAMVTAPEHERRKVRLTSGREAQVALPEGGLRLAGTVVGERSLDPIPDARVMIDGGSRFLSIERIADEEGAFSFEGLPRGEYQIVAYADGQSTAEAVVVNLVPGFRADNFMIPVFEGLDIAGVVFDIETDEPIEGVSIYLHPADEASATTNEEGFFRIDRAMGPWPRSLRAEKDGYVFDREALPAELSVIGASTGDLPDVRLGMRRERWLIVNAPDHEGPALLMLAGKGDTPPNASSDNSNGSARALRLTGEKTRIPMTAPGRYALFAQDGDATASDLVRFELLQEESEVEVEVRLIDPARLRGQVARPEPEDPEQEPAPLPRFRAVLATELAEDSNEWADLISIGGDSGGEFDFRALPDGEFRLAISRPDSLTPFHEEMVTLVRGEVFETYVELEAGRTLDGVVSDAFGEPLVGADVNVLGWDTNDNVLFLTMRTFADGTFSFQDLGGDSVREVRVEHGMHAPWVGNDIALDGSRLEIQLDMWERLRVVLPEVPQGDAAAFLMMASQSPIPFVGVATTYAEVVRAEFHGESWTEIEPRLNGEYRVAVQRDGQWDVSSAFQWSRDDEGRDVPLNPGSSSAGRLRVVVEGAADARELDAVIENVALPSMRATTEFRPSTSSADSLLFDPIPPGEYLLTVFDDDGASAVETGIDLPSGGSREIRVSLLREEVELIGTVLLGSADDSDPASGARVALLDPDIPEGTPVHSDTLGNDGTFVFPGLQPDKTYQLRVEVENRSPSFFTVRIPSGAEDTISDVYVIEMPVTVLLDLPERVFSGPQIPVLLFPEAGGSPTMIPPNRLAEPVEVAPGGYRVTWGEEPLGTTRIPTSGSADDPPRVQIAP